MRFTHLHRYRARTASQDRVRVDVRSPHEVVARGWSYDLRTQAKGARAPGFSHALDGRYLAFEKNTGALCVHHPDGHIARVEGTGSFHHPYMLLVGDALVVSYDAREPLYVVDARSGARLGLLDEQQRGGIPGFANTWSPALGDPRDGRSLWLNEGARLACFDIPERRLTRAIAAPEGYSLLGAAPGVDGLIGCFLRPIEALRAFRRDADELALFDAQGALVARRPCVLMGIAAVGSHFVTVEDSARSFGVYDAALREVDRVPIFEAATVPWAELVALPDGRGWIATGDHGEWDHYGAREA